MKNYYEILNATPTSTLDELKANYKQLILQYHPDKRRHNQQTETKQEGPTAASDVTEKNKFLDIAEAWNCLKDSKKRKQYDAELMLNKFQMHQNIYTRISLCDMTKYQEKDDKKIESNCQTTTTTTTKPQYCYVYNCGCGGQYIVDGVDESTKKLHRKHHNTRIPQQKHNNKNSSKNVQKNNAEGDSDNKANGINMDNDDHNDEEEADFELIVECDECSLAIIIN